MKGKVVIITGASSGIGKSCAFEFSKFGAKLMLVARSEKKLQEISAQINQNGGTSIFCVTDVSLKKECENMVQKTISHFGQIDILINIKLLEALRTPKIPPKKQTNKQNYGFTAKL